MKIGIDPGHGGRDPGAVGPTGLREKDVTLAVALRLRSELMSDGHQVVTRTSDSGMTLFQRSNLLNEAQCDLAISIHCNANTKPGPNYVATFIQATGGQAEKLAQKVQAELVQATGWPDGGVRVQNLHMTRETRMPAILVECGFISNPDQERQLADPGFRKKLARAIADGVLAYLGLKQKGGESMADVRVIIKGKELPGKLIDGTTYVPVRTLVEALNNQVLWDDKDRVVIVK